MTDTHIPEYQCRERNFLSCISLRYVLASTALGLIPWNASIVRDKDYLGKLFLMGVVSSKSGTNEQYLDHE